MSVTRSQLIDGVGISSFSNVTVSNTTTSQNLNVSGISTLSNVVVGGATTEVVITGDLRVTGIITTGTGTITIDSVIVGKADLPDDLVAAVNRVVTAQSAFKEQEQKTLTAESKAKENAALASTVTSQSLEYQRNEILKAAFQNGSIQKMVIINGSKMDFLPGGLVDGK